MPASSTANTHFQELPWCSTTRLLVPSAKEVPAGADVVDGTGYTLLPGLIDAHVHTKIPELRATLEFDVTTELEMMGHWTPEQRKEVAQSNDIADVKTAEFGLTVCETP